MFNERDIKPTSIIKSETNPLTKQFFLGSEINLSCMLSAYYLGTGPFDITKHLCMIGCDINHNFYRNFERNSKAINAAIIETCNFIIELQMVREVEATLQQQQQQRTTTTHKSLKEDIQKCKHASNYKHYNYVTVHDLPVLMTWAGSSVLEVESIILSPVLASRSELKLVNQLNRV